MSYGNYQHIGDGCCEAKIYNKKGYIIGNVVVSNGGCFDSPPAGTVLSRQRHPASQGIKILEIGGWVNVPEKMVLEEYNHRYITSPEAVYEDLGNVCNHPAVSFPKGTEKIWLLWNSGQEALEELGSQIYSGLQKTINEYCKNLPLLSGKKKR